VFPSIFPISSSSTRFSLNIKLDKRTEMLQGSLIIQLNGPNSKNIDFGRMNGTSAFVDNIPSSDLNAGIYEIQLNYQHPQSLAFNEQFKISSETKNLTFVDVEATISFVICSNVFYAKGNNSIGIKRSIPVNTNLSQFVKCKLGNNLVSTLRIADNHFICNITSDLAGILPLSLWYSNNDTLNNEMLLSKNYLNVVFVEKIVINSVNPFTTVIGSIATSELSTNFEIDVFHSNVSYQCKYGNEFAIATLSKNGTFSCGMLSNVDASRNENLILQLKSQDCSNWFDFSTNSVEYIFRKPVTLVTISPFSKGYSANSNKFTFNVTFDLDRKDNIVNDKGLICKFNSSGNGLNISKVILQNNLIICEISKTIFKDSIEYLHVGLSLNTSQFTGYFSNLMKFVFYREPLSYQFISVFDDSLNGNFELGLPNYESDFNYQMNFTEQITLKSGSYPCMKGTKLVCKPSVNLLNSLHQPSIYNLTLVITKDFISSTNSLNTTTVLNVNSILYFNRNNKIISAAPFIGSSVAHATVPLKIRLSMENLLNHGQFKFNCINSSNGQILSDAIISNSSSLNTTFTCQVKSNRNVGSFPLSVSFVYNSTNYQFATNASIQFVERITLDNFYGFKNGKTSFTFQYPTKAFPTLFKTDYNFKLMYNDYNEFKSIQCSVNNGYVFGSCSSPSINANAFPRNVQFSVFVDEEFSISLNPWFRYLEIPTISNILPSSSIDIFNSDKTIKLQSSSFFPNSQNKRYKIQFVELGNAIQECITESSSQISCLVPKNNQLTGNLITMKISIDGENYETLNKKLYLYATDTIGGKSISSSSILLPNVVSSSNRTNITMQINIPSSITLPTNLLFVRFKDQIIEEFSMGIIQNGEIICEVPHFGRYNVYYPRFLSVDVSLDGDSYFGSTKILQVKGFEKIDILPTLFIVGSDLKVYISNFPALNLKSNERIMLKMISRTTTVEFNCTFNTSLCESSKNHPIDEYTLNWYIHDGVNENRFFIPSSVERISILAKPILELQTFKILREMKNVMYLNGNGFSMMKNSIKIRGLFDGKLMDASVTVETNRIGFLFSSIKRSMKRSSFNNQLQISYNDGIHFEILSSNIQLIDSFTFDKITSIGDQSSVTFSFQNTSLNLIGTNLNQSKAIIKLENELFSFSTEAKSQDSTSIQVEIPQFSYYSPNIPFNFPVSATIGVSLNGGVDFQTNAMIISDKFSNFFLVGFLPTLGDRKSRNITMRGANLKDVVYCIFKDSNRVYIDFVRVIKDAEETICPFEYHPKYDSVKSVFVSLKNSFNDTSDEFHFYLVGKTFIS
jgi:hypothetical protein